MSSTQHSESQEGRDGTEKPHRAGAFDMRNFIAALLGIYGIVLVIYGLIGSNDTELAKSDGLNINLWAGLGMVAVAATFLIWARLRPVVVPAHVDSAETGAEQAPPSH
jgi:hypothetical protein